MSDQYVIDQTKKTKVTVMASVLTVAATNDETQDMLDFNMTKKMFIMLVVMYLFTTISEEMNTLNKKTTEKTSVEHNKILYKRNRMKESLKFEVVSGMEMVITKFILLDRDKRSIEIGDMKAVQVASSNLDSIDFPRIYPIFVSGTWLLHPVPTHHGQLFGDGMEVYVDVGLTLPLPSVQ